jgi:hypothetical protein
MSKVEELTAASMLADEEAERQSAIFRQLESELECDGMSLSSSDYIQLQARCSQQERRVEAAIRKACEKQAALDEARSLESARLAREMAQNNYDARLAELRQTQAEILSKRQALAQLQNELPGLEQRASSLLFSLDQAKTALQQSA